MLIAIGMTLVIATGGVDLSVGAVMRLAGSVASYLVVQKGMNVPTAIAAALAVSLLAGLWNGILVALLELQPIVATLVLMVAGRGIAMLITEGQTITFEKHSTLTFFGRGAVGTVPFPIILAVVTLVVVVLLTRKTAAVVHRISRQQPDGGEIRGC